MASSFSVPDFLGRWLFAAILVIGTYNPTRWSWFNWITSEEMSFGPLPALATVALIIAWVIFLRATFLAMGALGIILASALFGCLAWLMFDLGVFDAKSGVTITWVGLTVLSLVLATGMSWAHIRRAMSGQVVTDDVEEG